MDIHVIELVCSRLCHDLISPVGAIHNGLELIEEMEDEPPGGFLGEAVKLIGHSSTQADRRLRLFRLAYGLAGRDMKDFEGVRTTAIDWLEGARTRLDWPPGVPSAALAIRPGLGKTLLNTVMLAEEALTHGGTVSIESEGTVESGLIRVTAAGRPGALNPDAEAALAGPAAADALTPRSVHAFVTGRIADAYGVRLTAAPSGRDLLEFRLEW